MEQIDHEIHTPDDLCKRYSGRGLGQSVRDDAEHQNEREMETAKNAPDAYRLSSLDVNSRNRYKTGYIDGERRMTEQDVIRYTMDTRHPADTDENNEVSRWNGCGIVSGEAEKQKLFAFPHVGKEGKETNLTSVTVADTRAGAFLARWFPKDGTKYVNATKHRRFPSTYMAVLFVVIISMALLVGSILLLNRQEREVLALKDQLGTLEKTEASLDSELEIKNDLYSIRDTAVREYGMIDSRYVTMKFLTLTGDEQIVAYHKEEEKKVGLAALLSGFFGGRN